VTAQAWDVPDGPVDQPPTGYTPATEQQEVLLHALHTASIQLGTYDEVILRWVAGWDWPTVAVITSWITRATQSTDNQRRDDERECGCPEDYHHTDCSTLRPGSQPDPGDLTDAFYRDAR
jgi:hypothetical protein